MSSVCFTCKERQVTGTSYRRSISHLLLALIGLSIISGSVSASSLGLFTDNASDEMRLFDADTGVVVRV